MAVFRKVYFVLFHHRNFLMFSQAMPRVKWIGFLLTVAKVWTVVCRRLLPYVVFLCAKYEGGLLKRSAYSLAV